MRSYWSCTRLADAIRGVQKPHCGTASEWNSWHREARSQRRFRYWLTETVLDRVQDVIWFVPDVWLKIRGYLLNRWVTETHLLRAHTTSIPPGSFVDFGDRLLPCVFDSFARWVERGCGLDYLNWASDLTYDESYGFDADDPRWGTLTSQARSAREILVLYWWWTVERPRRVSVDNEVVEFFTRMREKYPDDVVGLGEGYTEEELYTQRSLWERSDQLTREYSTEDSHMFRRLIDIRESLWT